MQNLDDRPWHVGYDLFMGEFQRGGLPGRRSGDRAPQFIAGRSAKDREERKRSKEKRIAF